MVFCSDYSMMIIIHPGLIINMIVYQEPRVLLSVFFYYLVFGEP